MAAFQGLLKLTTPLDISTSLKILCLTKILLINKKYVNMFRLFYQINYDN